MGCIFVTYIYVRLKNYYAKDIRTRNTHARFAN